MADSVGDGWVLAIDFGTSNTTAAMASAASAVLETSTVLEIENSRYLPSVVYRDEAGQLITGRSALRQAAAFPERAERVPKRALAAGGQVVLGGAPVPVTDLVAAVLSRVYAEAIRYQGGRLPERTVLTCPARWAGAEQARLLEAARVAGIEVVTLIPEPVAAAWWYARPSAGRTVAVFDLGGGTLDTAVLRADGDGYVLVGPPGGDPDLGGEDFDELLVNRVRGLARERDAEVWATEFEAGGIRARRDLALLRGDVTAAKETLSDHRTTDLAVVGYADAFRVTRPEFETLIGPAVERAVAELRQTIAAAGLTPADIDATYLTGGSSRIPVVAARIADVLGKLPEMRDDPKAVVALGAIPAMLATPAPPPPPPPPVPEPPEPEPELPPEPPLGNDDITVVLDATVFTNAPGVEDSGSGEGAARGKGARSSRRGGRKPKSPKRRRRRKRVLAIVAAVLAVLAAAGGVIGYIQPWKQPPLLPPTGVTVVGQTVSSVTIKWNGPVTGPLPDQYQVLAVEAHGNSQGAGTPILVPGNQTSYTATGLAPDTSYAFYVSAVRGGNDFASAVYVTGSTLTPLPADALLTGNNWLVTYTVNYTNGPPGETAGNTWTTDTWSFKPTCNSGPCAATLNGEYHGVSFTYELSPSSSPSGTGYTSYTGPAIDLNNYWQCNNYYPGASLNITVTPNNAGIKGNQWVVTSFTATVNLTIHSNQGCGGETATLTVTS